MIFLSTASRYLWPTHWPKSRLKNVGPSYDLSAQTDSPILFVRDWWSITLYSKKDRDRRSGGCRVSADVTMPWIACCESRTAYWRLGCLYRQPRCFDCYYFALTPFMLRLALRHPAIVPLCRRWRNQLTFHQVKLLTLPFALAHPLSTALWLPRESN